MFASCICLSAKCHRNVNHVARPRSHIVPERLNMSSKFLTSGSRMIISEQNLVYGVIR